MKNIFRQFLITALVAVIGFGFVACDDGGGSTTNTTSTYAVTVNGGSGSGSYTAGANVTITATVPSGQQFTNWTVNSGGATLVNANSASTSFTMPANAVTVTANFTGGGGTAPTITTASLPNGTVGTAYSQTVTATGDTPITWSIDTGTLPNGLTLYGTGVISGTPSTAGTSEFTVKATNATGSSTKQLSITITTKVLNKDMTIQQMLQCTSGSITIELATWDSMKNTVYWSEIYSYTGQGSTSSRAILTAYVNYIEAEVYTFTIVGDPYRPGVQLAGYTRKTFRYTR